MVPTTGVVRDAPNASAKVYWATLAYAGIEIVADPAGSTSMSVRYFSNGTKYLITNSSLNAVERCPQTMI